MARAIEKTQSKAGKKRKNVNETGEKKVERKIRDTNEGSGKERDKRIDARTANERGRLRK